MFWRKKTEIASGNKLLSDNTNAVVNLNVDLNGIKDIVEYIFPAMRKEKVLEHRIKNLEKILEIYVKAKKENIPINPIPIKTLLPIFENMSLENESDMYEKWAKLLIAVGVKTEPIHQQYADLLSNLNSHNANFLKEIYTKQTNHKMAKEKTEEMYNEYIMELNIDKIYREVKKNDEPFERPGKFIYNFEYPHIITGTEKSIKYQYLIIPINNSDKIERDCLLITREEKNMLIGLERLGLIRYQEINNDSKEENDKVVLIERYGVLLTKFGFSFIDCLEHPTG